MLCLLQCFLIFITIEAQGDRAQGQQDDIFFLDPLTLPPPQSHPCGRTEMTEATAESKGSDYSTTVGGCENVRHRAPQMDYVASTMNTNVFQEGWLTSV